MSRFETPGWSRYSVWAQAGKTLAGGATLALVVQLGIGLGGTGGYARAQTASVITNNPSVIVDLGVLEALGGGPVTLGAPALTTDPAQRGPIVTAPLGNLSAGTTPAPLQAPPVAPRSRLNASALAALGVEPAPPPARAAPAPPRPPVASAPQRRPATPEVAPAPRTAAVTPPPPPARTATTPARAVASARSDSNVPPPPVLPTAPVAKSAPVSRAAPAVTPPPAPPAVPEVAAVTPPPAAPRAAAPAAAPASAIALETQTARVAPSEPAERNAGPLSIAFNEGSAVLPDTARGDLNGLVEELTGDPTLKVQLRAYAAGTADTTSQARRLSLSRALAVRSFLIENGVQTTRMDVRALGNKSGDGPADRVDVVMVDQ